MTRALVLLILIAVVSSQQTSVEPVVRITRAPGVLFDDEAVVVTVRVDPREGNRLLIVGAWDESGSIRTSLEQLEGEHSPRTRTVRWPRLIACECEIRAYVFGTKGQLGMDKKQLTVLARWVE